MLSRLKPVEFEWDEGNYKKNWSTHKVKIAEAEEVFFDSRKQEYPDPHHSAKEKRKIVVGRTNENRLLFIVYTIRRDKIRIISARDLNKKKEKDLYEKAA